MFKIAIIGGGAAGIMAAATIAEIDTDAEFVLIEKNPMLGQKVMISGGGRCNLTTGLTDIKQILSKYPRGSMFLRTAMYNFPPWEFCKWLEKHGISVKTEPDLRVFPSSNKGKDIVDLFERLILAGHSKILFKTTVVEIIKKADKFIIKLNTGENLEVDKLILTTGGQAYQQTGSVGDGYRFAENLGHSISPLAPSLNAFLIDDQWVKDLSGISFEKVDLRFQGIKDYNFSGPIMFTHKGITGPAVFAISALAAYEKFNKKNPAKIFIDFCPEMNYEELSLKIENQLAKDPQKAFYNTLSQFVPKSFAKSICDANGIGSATNNSDISKKDINKSVETLKNFLLTVVGISSGEEFVTAGGVKLDEVDPNTMQSKICPGLYFAGEILDVDGFTGGFNLHSAWASSRLAAKSILV